MRRPYVGKSTGASKFALDLRSPYLTGSNPFPLDAQIWLHSHYSAGSVPATIYCINRAKPHERRRAMVTSTRRTNRSFAGFAAAGLFTAALLSLAPLATAQPIDNGQHQAAEWDIGEYDACVAQIPPGADPDTYIVLQTNCCLKSGGVHTDDPHTPEACRAPAARPVCGSVKGSQIGENPIDISDSVRTTEG